MKKAKTTTAVVNNADSVFDGIEQAFEALKSNGNRGGFNRFLSLILDHSRTEAGKVKEGKKTTPSPLTAREIAEQFSRAGKGSVSNVDVRRSFQPLMRKDGKRLETGETLTPVECEGKPYTLKTIPQDGASGGIGYLMIPRK